MNQRRRRIKTSIPEARLEIRDGHQLFPDAQRKRRFLQCELYSAARVHEFTVERHVTVPATVLGVLHRDLSRSADSPIALPVKRNDTGLLGSRAKTVHD